MKNCRKVQIVLHNIYFCLQAAAHSNTHHQLMGHQVTAFIVKSSCSVLKVWAQDKWEKSSALSLDTSLFQVCWGFTGSFLQTLSTLPPPTHIKSLREAKTARICRQIQCTYRANNHKVHCTSPLSLPVVPTMDKHPPYSHLQNSFVPKNSSLCAFCTRGARNEHPLVHCQLLIAKKLSH